MNNHQTKRRFSTEFKLEAITQVITHRQRVPDVARALELHRLGLLPASSVFLHNVDVQILSPEKTRRTSSVRRYACPHAFLAEA
ncbi:hypothetical protein Ppb6_01789 [Photorhabdus australis subsp. thailandensis]|uniref:Transposase n=1 Tax=Photorhabdus australis subsp. thailandensis TaxID=2805096 RepID=A0A1C0U540_9GAMM|nr:hypothetical protein Ppb6_01789 [Photorhabdus australis subsp. thailandensis]